MRLLFHNDDVTSVDSGPRSIEDSIVLKSAGLGAGEALDGEAARRHASEAATAVGDRREAGFPTARTRRKYNAHETHLEPQLRRIRGLLEADAQRGKPTFIKQNLHLPPTRGRLHKLAFKAGRPPRPDKRSINLARAAAAATSQKKRSLLGARPASAGAVRPSSASVAASVVSLRRAVRLLSARPRPCFGDGDLSAPARRSDQGRAAADCYPTAVRAGAPATRGAAAELVDELVAHRGEAGSERLRRGGRRRGHLFCDVRHHGSRSNLHNGAKIWMLAWLGPLGGGLVGGPCTDRRVEKSRQRPGSYSTWRWNNLEDLQIRCCSNHRGGAGSGFGDHLFQRRIELVSYRDVVGLREITRFDGFAVVVIRPFCSIPVIVVAIILINQEHHPPCRNVARTSHRAS